MKENLVRNFIRNVLSESSSPVVRVDPVSRADKAELAVVFERQAEIDYVIIYDPKEMQLYLDEITATGDDINKIYVESIVERGIIRACVSYKKSSDPCNGANIIATTVSYPGSHMGPAAYDIAMWKSTNGLASDRALVTASAQSVWGKYDDRADVGETDFDDIDNPQTVPTEDDCKIHTNIPSLNKSYKLYDEPIGLSAMMNRHEEFQESVAAAGFKYLQNRLYAASKDLFRDRYRSI